MQQPRPHRESHHARNDHRRRPPTLTSQVLFVALMATLVWAVTHPVAALTAIALAMVGAVGVALVRRHGLPVERLRPAALLE